MSDIKGTSLNNEALNRLKEILAIQTHSTNEIRMSKFLKKTLLLLSPESKIETDSHGNIFFTKGKADFYPGIASHIDTVHDVVDEARIIELENKLYAYDTKTGKQIGTGGDDKVGIFIALELIRKLPAIKCAFFSREEIGCKGSGAADMSFFKDCAFVIQADRRGHNDIIKTGSGVELFSEEFQKELEKYSIPRGFKDTFGSNTDVVELKRRGLDVCVFNSSCGYHNPHSDKEWCEISQVFNTLDLFEEICIGMAYKKWEHKYEKRTTTYTSGNWEGYNRPSHNTWNGSNTTTTKKQLLFPWGKELNSTTEEILDEWRVMTIFYPMDPFEINENEIDTQIAVSLYGDDDDEDYSELY